MIEVTLATLLPFSNEKDVTQGDGARGKTLSKDEHAELPEDEGSTTPRRGASAQRTEEVLPRGRRKYCPEDGDQAERDLSESEGSMVVDNKKNAVEEATNKCCLPVGHAISISNTDRVAHRKKTLPSRESNPDNESLEDEHLREEIINRIHGMDNSIYHPPFAEKDEFETALFVVNKAVPALALISIFITLYHFSDI